jgi:death-on-curing protein
MITISKEQVKRLHSLLLEQTGGMDGIRDEGLLESALASAFHSFEDEDLYPSVVAKIARITYSLVRNHAFVDGNKRIGTYVMLVLLDLNRIAAEFSDEDVIRIGLELAAGLMSYEQLLALILEHAA